jgi:hypothetical protein
MSSGLFLRAALRDARLADAGPAGDETGDELEEKELATRLGTENRNAPEMPRNWFTLRRPSLAACRRAFVNVRNDLRKGADREPPLAARFCQTGPDTLTTGVQARACSALSARRANLLQKWSLRCQSCARPQAHHPAKKPPGVALVAAFSNAFAANGRCREFIQGPVSWRFTTPDPARACCHFG